MQLDENVYTVYMYNEICSSNYMCAYKALLYKYFNLFVNQSIIMHAVIFQIKLQTPIVDFQM